MDICDYHKSTFHNLHRTSSGTILRCESDTGMDSSYVFYVNYRPLHSIPPIKGSGEAGANPSCLRVRGGEHPG